MSRIAATLLTIEVIVVALAVPVAVNVSEVSAGRAWLVAGSVIVLCIAGAATARRGRVGYVIGTAAQVAALGMGFIVTAMFFIGAVFAALWLTLMRIGPKVEAISGR
jgi:hypothetical protein